MKGFNVRTPLSLPIIQGRDLQKWIILAGAFALAVFMGLFVPLLGFQSSLSTLVFILALSIVIGFAAVVYSAARSRAWALQVFLVISVFLIEATFRQRELTSQAIDAQTLLKLGIWCLALLIAFISTRGLSVSLFQGDIKWLTLFSLLCLGSTVYSLTPAYTFGGGVAAISYCALAVCAVEHLTKQQILYSLLIGISLLLILSLALFAMHGGMTAPEGGSVMRLGGITGAPNSLGRSAALGILVVGALVFGHKLPIYSWRCLTPLGLAMACLILSDSRTSMLAVFAAFSLYLLRRRPILGFTVIAAGGMVGLVLFNLDVPWQQLGQSVTRTGQFSEITTLTGRTDIWYATWNAFLERPLLGYGYGATKVLLPEVYRNFWGFTVPHAHNFYLQTAVTTGIVGLTLVVTAVVRQAVDYITRPQLFPTLVFGFIMIQGLTEAGPMGQAPTIVTLFWTLSLCWKRIQDNTAGNQAMENVRSIPK